MVLSKGVLHHTHPVFQFHDIHLWMLPTSSYVLMDCCLGDQDTGGTGREPVGLNIKMSKQRKRLREGKWAILSATEIMSQFQFRQKPILFLIVAYTTDYIARSL